MTKTKSDIILFVAAIVAVISLTKGLTTVIPIFGEPYWVVDYSSGFLKRALLGTIFSWLYEGVDLQRRWVGVLALHLVISTGLMVTLVYWARKHLTDMAVAAALFLFAASQFLPTLAYNVGYLDVYIYISVLLCFLFAARGRYIWVAAIGFIAPFIHESFIFVWAGLMVLVVVDAINYGWSRSRIASLVTPIVASIIVYVSHSPEAGVAEMNAAPISDFAKEAMIRDQYGLGIRELIGASIYHLDVYRSHFIQCCLFYLVPFLAMFGVYALGRRLSPLQMGSLLLAGAAPAAINLIAWDVSRFLVPTSFSMLAAILYAEGRWKPAARPLSPILLAGVSALVAFYLLVPLIYAYYPDAYFIRTGLLPIDHWPVGRGAEWYVREIYNP